MTSPTLVRLYDVRSADGTVLRAWTNDADGPTVIMSNGLGTNPFAWPSLLDPDCGVRVIGWYHRGVGGSERPASGRIDMDAHIEDIVAVMDDAGVESAVVAGWSIGVNIAFELATREPDRVTGILATGGVPGATFSTMLAPLRVPPLAAHHLMSNVSRLGQLVGPGIAPLWTQVPWTPLMVKMVQATRFISPDADPQVMRTLLTEFFRTDPAWFARLASAASRHARVSLSSIDVPTTFIAASGDILAGSAAMRSAAERIPGARFLEVRGSHFIAAEHPEVVLEELKALLERVEGQPVG